MRIVFWGTYDLNRERYRILVQALKLNGIDFLECHEDVWAGIRDKSMLSSWQSKLRICVRYIQAYLKLILKYMSMPDHDAVLLGYLGHFDVLILWPFAKLRRKPIVWDALTSLYDEIITDRKYFPPTHPLAHVIFRIEWLICHLADRIFLPSAARVKSFAIRYGLPKQRARVVFLGVESTSFPPRKSISQDSIDSRATLSVLFYGSFIPLHGIETIINAARLMITEDVNWTIIGSGQMAAMIHKMLREHPLPRLRWVEWVPYRELSTWIHNCDVALGIFGSSERAATSIPNKVFQILSCGVPLITRDSPAIREILDTSMSGVYLVEPDSPKALVHAIRQFISERNTLRDRSLHKNVCAAFNPGAIGKRISSLTGECL